MEVLKLIPVFYQLNGGQMLKSCSLKALFFLIAFCFEVNGIISKALAQDFKISETGDANFAPHAAADLVGNFVVVWTDYRNAGYPYGGTGSDGDIYGQRFTSNGIPIGGNFRISDDSSPTNISFAGQAFPRVAMNDSGRFVVVWVDNRLSNNATQNNFDVYAQRFYVTGDPIGSNFMVNNDSARNQLNPDVMMRKDGSFVVVWSDISENFEWQTFLQLFNSHGERIGTNQSLQLAGRSSPRIEQFENGNFIIVVDSSAQIYDRFASPIGLPIKVFSGNFLNIKITKLGRIFLTFTRDSAINEPSFDSDIFIQAYDSLGNVLSKPLKVNDDSTYYTQAEPTLAVDDSFIFVAWLDHRNGYEIGYGTCKDIYAQRFDYNLVRIGDNFKVTHEIEESAQIGPAAILRSGKVYVTWTDARSKEFYPVHPPSAKLDIWATIINFENPIRGNVIFCRPPKVNPPMSFTFFRNYPNPFTTATTFYYELQAEAVVELVIYNIFGQKAKSLFKEPQDAGRYWKAFQEISLPSGVYFAQLTAKTATGETISAVRKVIIIK